MRALVQFQDNLELEGSTEQALAVAMSSLEEKTPGAEGVFAKRWAEGFSELAGSGLLGNYCSIPSFLDMAKAISGNDGGGLSLDEFVPYFQDQLTKNGSLSQFKVAYNQFK